MASSEQRTAASFNAAALLGSRDLEARRLREAIRMLRSRELINLRPILPLVFNLNGTPYTLDNHFVFEPFFNMHFPPTVILKSGRQVSKSTSLAAQGILMASMIPYFDTLYVTPLYEMIRRFSNNYVRKFIEDSPVKRLWMNTKTDNNVLQRSFLNRSKMIFSFAYLDVDRTRGVSASKLAIDESVRGDTSYLEGLDGPILLRDARPGMAVKAFDDAGNLIWTHVQKQWYAGRRRCYRLSLANGSYVDATAESWLATDAGCFRVSSFVEIVRDRQGNAVADCDGGQVSPKADATSAANGVGNHARGRPHLAERQLSRQPRVSAKGVPLAEVHALTRVRLWETFQVEEERTRTLVDNFLDCRGCGIQVLAASVVPGRAQADHASGFAADRRSRVSGVRSLVVGGRREPVGTTGFSDADFLHGRVPARRGRTFSRLDDGSWVSVLSVDAECSRLSPLPADLCEGLGGRAPVGGGSAADAAMYALQAQRYWAERCGNLYVLRESVPAEDTPTADGFAVVPVLRGDRLSEGVRALALREKLSSAQEAKSSAAQSVLAREPARDGETTKGAAGLGQSPSGAYAGEQKEISSKETPGSSTDHVAVFDLRQSAGDARKASANQSQNLPGGVSASASSSTGQTQLLSEAADNSQAEATSYISARYVFNRRLAAHELISIEDLGLWDVYDVEVAPPHSVLVNSVAGINCQDMDRDFIPILSEVMSASEWSITQLAGTPKTLENTIEQCWTVSSQGEWVIPCPRCHKENVPALAWDLDEMIGPWHPDISEARPGVICAKCKQPLSPRLGRWMHNNPDLVNQYAGFHVPQIVMPMHYADPKKWKTLVDKREGRNNTTKATFYNEVCGESYDLGAKLVTVTDLKQAANLGPNTVEHAKSLLDRYLYRVLAVDWGGGGEKMISLTTVAVMGITPSGRVEVVYGWRSLTPHDYLAEAREILRMIGTFNCSHLVHDYTGAGEGRHLFLVHSGFPDSRIIGCAYIGAAKGAIIAHIPYNETTGNHEHWRVDKTRSLTLTCSLIKSGGVRFFDYDYQGADSAGLLHDFLALTEDKASRRVGSDIYTIIKPDKMSDDFAQAVNIGCMGLFHMTGHWPNVAKLAKLEADIAALEAANQLGMSQWDDGGY